MAEAEIITRRRKRSAKEKAALLSEVDAEGGRVAMVPWWHGLSESLLYNWRSVAKAAAETSRPEPIDPGTWIHEKGGRDACSHNSGSRSLSHRQARTGIRAASAVVNVAPGAPRLRLPPFELAPQSNRQPRSRTESHHRR